MTTIANRTAEAKPVPVEPVPNPALAQAQADVEVLLSRQGFSGEVLDAVAELANVLEREQLLWLQGALRFVTAVSDQVSALTREPIPPGAAKTVLAAVEALQASLQNYCQHHSKAASYRIDPKIHELTAVVNAEIERMFDQVEVFRWAVLEAQVDEDLDAGRFKTFGSSTAALSYLHKQAKKHNGKLDA